ncbi:phage tail tape measure protein [Candidatus Tokpelaia sp.]|uniref:phage tail tape measure protein n=1 Tax=Candidatus Tokpelaia sp. TaxID=2233777 RepID=UPI00123C3EAB|nr:phage tail tape measure protein [Candidatus Tokpelaia sp.]KAA6405677.1 phage tail tape measure protein [Candidatus Tokpelaia sp.]
MEVSLVLRLVDKMQEGLQSAKQKLKDFGDTVEKAISGEEAAKNLGKIGQEAEKAFDKAGQAARKAAEPVGNFSKETGRFFNEAGQAVGSFSDTVEGSYRRTNGVFARMRNNIRDAFIEFREETTEFDDWAIKGRFGAKNLEKKLQTLSAAAREARGEFLKTAAAAAPLLATIKQAANFDQTVKEFEKVTTNMGQERLDQLKAFALSTSQEVAFSAEQILLLMKAAVQNGIPDEDLERFSLFAARAGIAFDMAADDVGTALIKMKNSFAKNGIKMTEEEIEDLANAFNYLSNNTASTAKELVDFTQRAASVSGTMKMSAPTIAAVGAALISTGMPAEVAGTAFGTLGARIMAGSKPVRRGFETLGIDREQFIKDFAKDEQGTLIKLFAAIKAKGDVGQEALIGIAGGQQFKNLAKLTPEALIEAFAAINDKAARTDSVLIEANRQMSGAEMQFKLLQNQLKALSITIGNELLPPVLELTKSVGGAVKALTGWMHTHPQLTSVIVKTVAALLTFNVALKALKWLVAAGNLGLWRIAADFWTFDKAGRNIAKRSGLLARSFGIIRGGIGLLAGGSGILGGMATALTGYGAAAGKAAAGNRNMQSSLRGLKATLSSPLLKGGLMFGAGLGVNIANDFLQASTAPDRWKNLGNLFADAANGAMLGFIVGGPLGAAIGGIISTVWGAIERDSKTPIANIDGKMASGMADREYAEVSEALRTDRPRAAAILRKYFDEEDTDKLVKNGSIPAGAATKKFLERSEKRQKGKLEEFVGKGGKLALNKKDAANRGYDLNDPNLIYVGPMQGEQTELGKKLGLRGADIDAAIASLPSKQAAAAAEPADIEDLPPIIAPGQIPIPTAKPADTGAITNSNNTINQTVTVTINGAMDPQAVGKAVEAQLRNAAAAALHGGGQ